MKKMPTIFVGHGTPMNAIERNRFSDTWKRIGKELPTPKAILAVSAHWYTNGIKIMGAENPKMVYDMYGFPSELYNIQYNAVGMPELAEKIKAMVGDMKISIDNKMGFDHGVWSVLCNMYPNADIPTIEMSIDKNMTAQEHFETGKKLSTLREEGVLILGSGNIVHNFDYINFNMREGYKEAMEFDIFIKNRISELDFDSVTNYKRAGKISEIAFSTPEHFYPLLYVLGASDNRDKMEIFNNETIMGALSMTGYIFK